MDFELAIKCGYGVNDVMFGMTPTEAEQRMNVAEDVTSTMNGGRQW